MKRILCLALALCLTVTAATATHVTETTVTSYHLNQPINREILDRSQMPNSQPVTNQADAVYDDPYLSYQWGITQTGADLAWEALDDGYSVVVAVVDSGVDYTHEDLKNRVLIDQGYDFVNKDSDPMDDNGHGTHVSGIIAAEADNGVGITGMAGTLDVSILPVKVLNASGEGTTQNITDGILYAVNQGVDIINLSLGADVITPDVRGAIETALAADIFVVVASGNDGTICAPLSLANLDGVFTVGASTASDTVADFSNYGDCINTFAPGEEILSTYLNNQYAYQDGTSMAAPMASGAAAILLSQDPDLTNAALIALLSTETATATSTTSTFPMAQISMPTNNQSTFRTHAFQWSLPTAYSATVSCTTMNVYEALQGL